MADSHESSWFRFEYEQLRNDGLTGDGLRLAMYEKGIGYLRHAAEEPGSRKKDIIGVLKMIEYSQGWIDRTDRTDGATIHASAQHPGIRFLSETKYEITERYLTYQNPYDEWLILDKQLDQLISGGCGPMLCQNPNHALSFLIEKGFLALTINANR